MTAHASQATDSVYIDPYGKGAGEDIDVAAIYDAASPPPDDSTTDTSSESPFDHSWRPVDISPVLDGTWTPTVPTVGARADGQPLLYAGRVHTLASESEAGKTWFALSAARDELDAGHHVVYIDFEDDEGGIVGRLLALGTDRDAIRTRFHYIRPTIPIGSGIDRDDLRAVLTTCAPSLVVLDGVTAAMTLHGYDVISNRDVADFSRILPAAIAAAGAAVLLLDHVTKATEGRGKYALGAVHKLNGVTGASFVLEVITPARIGTTGRSRVRIAKDRPGQLRRHALPGFDDHGLDWFADLVIESHAEDFVEVSLTPPDATAKADAVKRPTIYMRRISDFLEGVSVPQSQRDLLDSVTGHDAHIRSAILALVREGFIEVTSGPRGAKLHTLAKRFEEITE